MYRAGLGARTAAARECLGGVMRIRRAILPAILTLGLAGSVLTGVTAGAAGGIAAPMMMHYHGHVVAMHYHG